jgi:hypothetical protein
MKPWLLRLRNIVEGSHTPSREERYRSQMQEVRSSGYAGQKCPCGAPATSIYQLQIGQDKETYYACAEHVGVTRWIPDESASSKWF